MRRFVVLLLVLCAASVSGIIAGQNSIAVSFVNAPAKNTHIGAFVREGTLYGSLNDLSTVLLLKTTGDPALKQFTIHGALTVTVTANNPFVAVTDKDTNTSLRQMPYRVLFGANSYFVPVAYFLPILNPALTEELALSDDGTAITVGKAVVTSPFDITGLSIDEKENGIAVRLIAARPLKNYESWLKPEGANTLLYITVDNANADTNALRLVKPAGPAQEVMVFPFPESIQLVVRLKGKATGVEPVQVQGSNDVVFAVRQEQPAPVTALPPETAAKGKDISETLARERNRWKLDCIVIDAGHGGQDPGTIGVSRTKEKDITLGIALKLGKLLEKNLPGVKVVYTRKTDEFIELYKRGQIANAAGGKLFISIHCNAAAHKPSAPNGFEIYLLRPGKTENALRIAARENEVVKLEKDYEKRYQTLNEERFILLTMAQSAYVKYSEKFAEAVVQEMKSRTDLDNNGVKQAGFYVLVGASMPNVLVETAYLSNKHDEKILRSGTGQQKIAESLLAAVKKYKQEYEKALSEGKSDETSE